MTLDEPVSPKDSSVGQQPGVVARALIFLVQVYRQTLGQWMGGHCRFEPTCSQYMMESLRKYGALVGLWRGLKRLARCHPWGGWGYDPP